MNILVKHNSLRLVRSFAFWVLLLVFGGDVYAQNYPYYTYTRHYRYTSSINNLTITPLTVTFSPPSRTYTTPHSSINYSVNNGTCDITLPDKLATVEPLHFTNVSASWTETSGGDISNRHISWSGTKEVKTVGGVHFTITAIDFSDNPSYAASMTIHAKIPEEVVIKDIVYIQKCDNLGNLTLTYNQNGTSSINYSGLNDFGVKLKAGGGESKTEIANATIATIDNAGVAHDVSLNYVAGTEFDGKGFTAKLDSLNLTFDYDIPNGNFTYKNGSGAITLKDIDGCNANDTIMLSLEFLVDKINTQVSTESQLHAFGFNIGPSAEGQTASFNATMEYNFEITEVKVEHATLSKGQGANEFKLEDVSFSLKNGGVETVSCGATKVQYATFKFDMEGVAYSGENHLLTVGNVELDVKGVDCHVSSLTVANDGTVNIGQLHGIFDTDPVFVEVTASLQDTQFSFDGTVLISETGLNGSVIIGSETVGEDTFAYGYVSIHVSSPVDIGTTGLKFTQFGCETGYRWDIDTGSPSKDCKLLLGGTVGIGDKGNIFVLENTIRYEIGVDEKIELNGTVKVPANNEMLSGTLTAEYVFGSGAVDGTLSSCLKVPHDTGRFIDLTSGTIDYHFDENGYHAATEAGNTATGTFFNDVINMSGSFNVAGNYASGLQTANISGHLEHNINRVAHWPEEFTPENNYNAANWLDFGYYVYIDSHLDSSYYITFDESGFDGRFNGGFWFDGYAVIDWPNLTFIWDDGEPKDCHITIGAKAEIYKKDNNQIWLEGSPDTNGGEGGATFCLNGEYHNSSIWIYLGSI